jgi:hypothetical protein
MGCTLSADVEEDSLLVEIFMFDAGPVADQQFYQLSGGIVSRNEGCEVEGGLSELCLDLVHDGGVGSFQYLLDCLDRTALRKEVLAFDGCDEMWEDVLGRGELTHWRIILFG